MFINTQILSYNQIKLKKRIEFIYKNETRDLDLKLIVITYVPTTKSILENPQLKDTILHIFNTWLYLTL